MTEAKDSIVDHIPMIEKYLAEYYFYGKNPASQKVYQSIRELSQKSIEVSNRKNSAWRNKTEINLWNNQT